MNKFTKAGIATAAAVALLMGGAGTLAYWNESANLDADTVTAGHLDIVSNNDGAWDTSVDKIVPGDTLTYTETFVVSAVGDNLKFDLEATMPTLTGYDAITVTPTFELDDETLTGTTVEDLTAGEYSLEVTIVVAFPFGDDTPGDEDEDASIALGDVVITATQVAA